jgi:uncharacterized Zn-finger protein
MRISAITNRSVAADDQSEKKTRAKRAYDITEDDLPLHCPTKDVSLWNSHPRVYLPIENDGGAVCPYCGTRYRLGGSVPPNGDDKSGD